MFSKNNVININLLHLKGKCVLDLDWSKDGLTLATAGSDVRIWRRDGVLQHKLSGHNGSILRVKFNATWLLSSGTFKSGIICII